MSNDYYSVSGAPSTGSALDSAVIRSEFAAISAGFDKLPDLTSIANRIVHANAGSTALTTTSGFTFDGTTLTTPGLSVTDSTFSIKDNSDATKIAQFQCSGITTATTRTYTLPDASVTLAGTALANGGTNASLTASNGGIVYSDASGMAILAQTATAGRMLRSGANAAPTWSTATFPATGGTSGTILRSNGTNWVNSTATYPDSAVSAGKILRADGTNWSASTLTFPDTVSSDQILYATASNVIGSTSDFFLDPSESGGHPKQLVFGSGTGSSPYVIYVGGDPSTQSTSISADAGLALYTNNGAGSYQGYYVAIDYSDSQSFVIGRGVAIGSGNSFKISNTGVPYFPEHDTTASAANAYIDSGNGKLQRSTSSLRYKRDVEFADAAHINAVLRLEPIWYRSKCAGDNPDWSWWGLGAEDVAAVDPRLVHWTPEILGHDEHGQPIRGDRLVPDGVMYERVAVLTLGVVKSHDTEIHNIKARLAAAGI